MMVRRTSPSRTTLRSVAIPNEHGGWIFLLEPALIGLGAAFTAPGFLLALAALGVFLARHPFLLALDDYLKRRNVPRTYWAIVFALGYLGFAAVAFLATLTTAAHAFLLPLLLAMPLALTQLFLDISKRGRMLIAELAGAIAMGTLLSSILLLAGWDLKLAFAAWALLSLHSVTAILYVRARLRAERHVPFSAVPTWVSHAAALLAIGTLCFYGLLPGTALLAAFLWCIRAVMGLSLLRRPVRAQMVGVQETIMGLLTVVLVVAGYWLSV
jgi:hypothetical protein